MTTILAPKIELSEDSCGEDMIILESLVAIKDQLLQVEDPNTTLHLNVVNKALKNKLRSMHNVSMN